MFYVSRGVRYRLIGRYRCDCSLAITPLDNPPATRQFSDSRASATRSLKGARVDNPPATRQFSDSRASATRSLKGARVDNPPLDILQDS